MSLAPYGNGVPGWCAVRVVKIFVAVPLVLDRMHAGLETGVIQLAHFGFGELAIGLPNAVGDRMDVAAVGLEQTIERPRRGDDLAILVRRQQPDQRLELVGDWGEIGHGDTR
jgi:hypothetical protein